MGLVRSHTTTAQDHQIDLAVLNVLWIVKYDDKTTSIYSAKLNRRQDSNSSPSDSRTYKRPSNRYQTVDHLCNPIDHNHNDYQQSSHPPDTTPGCPMTAADYSIVVVHFDWPQFRKVKLCKRILPYIDELTPVPDSTGLRTRVGPDSTEVGPDSTGVGPDSTGVGPDSTVVYRSRTGSTGVDRSRTGFDGSWTGFDRSRTGFDRSWSQRTGFDTELNI